MAEPAYRRHDISDRVWGGIGVQLAWAQRSMGRQGEGQPPVYQRCFLDFTHGCAVAGLAAGLRRLEKHLSPVLPMAGQGHLGSAVGTVGDCARLLMADDRYPEGHKCQPCQSSPPRCWRKRRQPGHGGHKRGLNSKIHLAVDAQGMPVRMLVTSGTVADCSQAAILIEGLDALYLLADKGYDSDAIVTQAEAGG